MAKIKVGLMTNAAVDARVVKRMREVAETPIDHVGTIDHVSFHGGQGVDGLITAATLAGLDDRLSVYIGVYLLPLRHPMVVARQLATVAQLAPGRLIFGVGIGGEDRAEIRNCGVDPSTRGRRMDESLTVLRALLTGEQVDYEGEFFSLEEAMIRPAPDPAIPIIVGGRSDHAARRAGRLGDGWIGVFNSASRFERVRELVEEEGIRAGRRGVDWQHAMEIWCGFGADAEEARARLGPAMHAFYDIPYESFAKYAPAGRPEDIAEYMQPYLDAGCTTFNLIGVGGDFHEAVEGVAAVRRLVTG